MRRVSLYVVHTFGIILFFSGRATAQVATPAPSPTVSPQPAVTADKTPPAPDTAADIVVTGSRIARRDFTSESPIVTASQAQLQATGAVTVEAGLNELPQITSSAGASSDSAARGGQANVDLRGIGQQRTLVLIDGRRVQPSGSDNSVDLNIIPSSIIEGVEVITGGASSTYGSDAIAGVVNLKLRKHFSGVEMNAQYGISEKGDGQTKSGSILAGSNFADGKGNAYLAFDYSSRDAVKYPDRSFLKGTALSQSLPASVIAVNASNLPSQAAVNSVFANYGLAAGAVSRTATLSVNPDTTLFAGGNAANFRGPTTDLLEVYNGTVYAVSGKYFYAQIPLQRKTVAGHVAYDLSPSIQLTLDGLYTNYQATTRTNAITPGTSSGTTIFVPVTNPFNPADLKTILASRPNPLAPFTISKNLDGMGPKGEVDDYNVYQITAGLHGKTGINDITWDVYGSTGKTSLLQTEYNWASSAAFQALISAPDGGASLCAGGLNPFVIAISQSCQNYLRRTPHNTSQLQQDVIEASAQGRILNLPAGELRFAVGADYRRNSYNYSPDALIKAGDIPNLLPINESSGAVNVKELFGELLVPLLHNLRFVEDLSLDLGYRYSDYNISGGVNTYKADFSWKVASALSFRGGYARATRAPSVGELFAATNQGQQTLGTAGLFGSGDPCDINGAYRKASNPAAAQVQALCIAQGVPANVLPTFTNQQLRTPFTTSGNASLVPESTDTYSIGAIVHSPFSSPVLSSFTLSLDYYRISLNRAIGLVTNPVAASQCFDAVANPTFSNSNYYCQLIRRDPGNGQITIIQNPLLNLGGYSTDGIDLAVDWAIPLSEVLSPGLGTLRVNSVVTYLKSFKIKTLPTSSFLDYAGTIGNTQIDQFADAHPRWKAVSSLSWQVGPVQSSLRWRYIGAMANAGNVGTSGTAHGVPAVSYFDLDASVKATSWLTIRGGIANLFDKDPPALTDGLVLPPTDINTYDLVGRRFFLAAQAKF